MIAERRRRSARRFVWLAALLLLGACTTVPIATPAPISPVPEPVSVLPPYRIQVGDVLDVKFLLNPELNEQVVVRPDGRVSTTVAQDVGAYGRTPAELTEALRAAYKDVLRTPGLSVVVRSFAPNRIYVAGEVTNPGEYITVGPNLTLVQAIARAGGVKLSANREAVFILRRGAGDAPELLSTSYMDAITGKDARADVRLAQYDVVYVPRTSIYELFTFWNQYLQQFVPVTWGFSYTVNPVTTVGVTR